MTLFDKKNFRDNFYSPNIFLVIHLQKRLEKITLGQPLILGNNVKKKKKEIFS